MKLIFALALSIIVVLSGCASSPKEARAPRQPSMKSGYADVNGIQMYYEIHGDAGGTPLVLIHGGGSSIDVTWSKMLPLLSANRKVIAVDEQAHGRSGDRNAPVSFEQTADDDAALLKS
ncbi:MAG TPA: hypothetical protein VM432_11615, partial [Bdellovibrionales bacterium]|nr:hypothetical protein [Bdellovibrionales bacterium]